jgi:hypothetical protein
MCRLYRLCRRGGNPVRCARDRGTDPLVVMLLATHLPSRRNTQSSRRPVIVGAEQIRQAH